MQRVFRTSFYFSFLVALTLGLFVFQQSSHAAVQAFGDVDPDEDPNLPLFGGTTSGGVTVGVTGIGRLAIDTPTSTLPLISQGTVSGDPAVIIGRDSTAVGEVSITGFGSQWEARGLGIIGDQGLAFLSLVGGSRFISGDEDDGTGTGTPVPGTAVLIMGNEAGSSAITTIDGFGSRLQSAYVMVGREGDAAINLINRGNMITLFDATMGVTDPNDFDDIDFPILPTLDDPSDEPKPTARVTVTGLGSRWSILDSLVLGNDGGADETGFAILEIGNQAVVQVGNQESTDGLLINRYGRVELTGGTLRTLIGLSGSVEPILNDGVIMGDGFVEGRINNGLRGEIRNAAGVANLREKLLVTGDVVNNNLIESIGGEMEFLAEVNNTASGDMIFRDAVIRFQDGVTNDGEIAFGGDTTLYGDITSGNTFLVLPDSTAVIRGNLQLNPGAVAAFTVGASVGTMDIIGTASLDGILSLNYSPGGVNAQPGDSYDLLTAHEGLFGTFSNAVASAGGLLWNIDYSATTVTVTAGGVAVPIGSDFNGDGIVDGQDLQIWQDNYGRTAPPDLSMFGDADGDGDVDGRDFMKIQRDFGGPGVPLTANLAAVPEPSALLLVLSASVCLLGRRRI